jgi:hypothetical protein
MFTLKFSTANAAFDTLEPEITEILMVSSYPAHRL